MIAWTVRLCRCAGDRRVTKLFEAFQIRQQVVGIVVGVELNVERDLNNQYRLPSAGRTSPRVSTIIDARFENGGADLERAFPSPDRIKWHARQLADANVLPALLGRPKRPRKDVIVGAQTFGDPVSLHGRPDFVSTSTSLNYTITTSKISYSILICIKDPLALIFRLLSKI